MGDISFVVREKVDLNGNQTVFQDIELKGGDLVLTNDYPPELLEDMSQSIKADLSVFLGEWFLDNPNNPRFGVDYLGSVLGTRNQREDVLNSVFTNAILKNKYVSTVDEVFTDIDKATRLLTVNFKCTAKSGQTLEDALQLRIG